MLLLNLISKLIPKKEDILEYHVRRIIIQNTSFVNFVPTDSLSDPTLGEIARKFCMFPEIFP